MRTLSVRRNALLLAGASIAFACAPRDVPLDTPAASVVADSVASARMRAHFATAQGFSVDSLNARAEWFTDSLLALLRKDMGDGTQLGALNWDPFTSYQDSAASYARIGVSAAGDTTLVAFAVTFAGADPTSAPDTVSLAMHFERAAWRIADFRSSVGSLADRIARSLASTP